MIQYASDLHVERLPLRVRPMMLAAELVPAPGAQVLVLAGDIGRDCDGSLATVLDYASTRWPHVVYVTGNHEYYGTEECPARDFAVVDAAVAALVRTYPNVHLLTPDQPTWDFADANIVFVGCTFWSDVDTNAAGLRARNGDFKCTVATPAFIKALHRRHKTALAGALATTAVASADEDSAASSSSPSSSSPKVVVVTHHMPSLRLVADKYRGAENVSCFASPCEWLFPGVTAWIYGHTHVTGSQVVDGCLCVVNALGYPGEQEGYNRAAVLEL